MEKHRIENFGEGFVEISQCWHQCPYFSLEGYRMGDTQGEALPMFCSLLVSTGHPYIIDMTNSIDGFPEECPLRRKE